MVEKIIIQPLEVRCLGNIVSPKTVENFDAYHSTLTGVDDVYNLHYASETTLNLSFTSSSVSSTGNQVVYEDNGSYNVTAILKDDTNNPLSDESIVLLRNGEVYDTATTDNLGKVVFTVYKTNVGEDNLICRYSGSENYGGSTSDTVLVKVGGFGLSLTSSVSRVRSGNSFTVNGVCNNDSVSVKLYRSFGGVDTLLNSFTGGFTNYSISAIGKDSYSYYIKVGDETSPIIYVTSYDVENIVLSSSAYSVEANSEVILSATLKSSDGYIMDSEETVEFFKGNTSIGSSTTNNGGVATFNAAVGYGDTSFHASVNNGVSSNLINVIGKEEVSLNGSYSF